VTVKTPDIYGGAAVTTKNIYRKQGESTWTEVAGAGSFNADPGETYDLIFGIGDANTEDDDQPFGPKVSWTVPCESYPSISQEVVDDSVEGDLVVRFWDPEDGTVIAAAATIDIDEGDVFNIKTEWQGAYEEDFGNRFCNKGNLMVIEYLSSNYTGWHATDLNGNKYPSATIPTLHTQTAGMVGKAWEVPVLKSNEIWTFYLVADASGSGKDPSKSNITVTLYDVNWYIDNDVTPPQVKCGWEDEDGNDVGSTGSDTGTIYLEND